MYRLTKCRQHAVMFIKYFSHLMQIVKKRNFQYNEVFVAYFTGWEAALKCLYIVLN